MLSDQTHGKMIKWTAFPEACFLSAILRVNADILGHSEKRVRNDEMNTLNLLSSTIMIMLP
ncbi:hypothetical protein VspSTUT11_33990 [Vibrio sp. STUT-A11]|nr:hypothetical protein VspSTUT11_33990 [Vibrio sp. STUT-A11]